MKIVFKVILSPHAKNVRFGNEEICLIHVIDFTLHPIFEQMNNEAAESNLSIIAKDSLEAIKSYSEENSGVIKEVNLYYVTRETNKLAAEINVNNDILLETDWKDISKRALSQIVTGYRFYGDYN